MTEPPFSLEEAYEKLYVGIDLLDTGDEYALNTLTRIEVEVPRWLREHAKMEHSFPSPSNCMECRLRLWFQGKNYKPDSPSPTGNKIARALGKLIEPYFMSAFETGGIQVGLPNVSHKCGEHMVAHPDAEIHDNALLEIKFISGYGYRKLIENPIGVEGVEKGHYMQAQLYMYSADKDWLLYLASPSNHGLVQSMMRQRKNYGQDYEMPACYLEWVGKNEDAIQHGLERGILISRDGESDEPPPKEFTGVKFRPNGTRSFPCGYCLWNDACNSLTFPSYRDAGIKFVQ